MKDYGMTLAHSSCGSFTLKVALYGDRACDHRAYSLFEESKDGEIIGLFEKDNKVRPDEVDDGGKITSIILNMYGKYRKEDITRVVKVMSTIEEIEMDMDDASVSGKLTVLEIISRFKQWMLFQPSDSRIKVIKLNKKTEVTILSGPDGFDSIFKLLAPDNDIKAFKNVCKSKGYLKCNRERGRFTYKIERNKAKDLGLLTQDVFLFNFDNDRNFVIKYLYALEADMKKEKMSMEMEGVKVYEVHE